MSTGGAFFIRCACTASRPVKTSPEISTTSPTRRLRTCSSDSGALQHHFAAGQRESFGVRHALRPRDRDRDTASS